MSTKADPCIVGISVEDPPSADDHPTSAPADGPSKCARCFGPLTSDKASPTAGTWTLVRHQGLNDSARLLGP
jgi:hypothetical protein